MDETEVAEQLQNGALIVVRGGHKIPEPDRAAIALRRFPTLEAVPSSSAELWDDYKTEVWLGRLAANLRKE